MIYMGSLLLLLVLSTAVVKFKVRSIAAKCFRFLSSVTTTRRCRFCSLSLRKRRRISICTISATPCKRSDMHCCCLTESARLTRRPSSPLVVCSLAVLGERDDQSVRGLLVAQLFARAHDEAFALPKGVPCSMAVSAGSCSHNVSLVASLSAQGVAELCASYVPSYNSQDADLNPFTM
jgi:hypothetical protein